MITYLLLCINYFYLINAGHIYVWDTRLTYGIDGYLDSITLPMKLTNGIYMGGYLHFGGIQLHNEFLYEIKAQLTYLDGTIILERVAASQAAPQLDSYYFPVNIDLPPEIFYLFTVYVTNKFTPGLQQQPIYIYGISSLAPQAHVYDQNMNAGILFIKDIPQIGMTVTISINTILYPYYTDPEAVYEVYIDITPRVSILNGALIIVQLMQTTELFKFSPLDDSRDCLSLADIELDTPALIKYSCLIENHQIHLQTTDQIVINRRIRIRVLIMNPPYVSVCDLRVLTQSVEEGYASRESGIRNNALSVLPINILATNPKMLWGIDLLKRMSDSYVALWAAQDPTTVQGPYNSVRLEFQVERTAPAKYASTVQVKLSCTDAVPSSAKHNLLAFNDNCQIYCTYIYPYLICKNVGQLSPSVTYYITIKVYFATPTVVEDFGRMEITLDSQVGLLLQYQSSAGIYMDIQSETNLYDFGGWHGPSGGLSYSQVSSIPSNDLSANNLQYVMGPMSTVGIVPTQSSLLFFFRAGSAVFCGPSDQCGVGHVGNKYLKVTIMINSALLTSDSLRMPNRLNFIANDGSGTFKADNFPCVSPGYCDLSGQNGYYIIPADGTSSEFGIASFECGDITSLSSNVGTNCNNFKGKTGGLGSEGILSLPSIIWRSGFTHTSQYADDALLDFVVTFWRGEVTTVGSKPSSWTRIASHLINAYTVDAFVPAGIRVSLVNYYMGRTVGNEGWRLPTLIRVKIKLTEEIHMNADNVGIFFDQSLIPDFFLDDYQYSCSLTCTASRVRCPSGGDMWQLQSSIETSVSNYDSFELLFPIVTNYPLLPKTIYIVLSKSLDSQNSLLRNPPLRVFRINGAAINSDSRVPIRVIGSQIAMSNDLVFPHMDNSRGSQFDLHLSLDSISMQKRSQLIFQTIGSDYTLESNSEKEIGAGLTIVSIGHNIFSQENFIELLSNQQFQTCFNPLKVSRRTQSSQDANYALPRYLLFCPFDVPLTYPLSLSFLATTSWAYNYKLETQLSYSISGSQGQLLVALNDPGVINMRVYQCKLEKTNIIYQNSLGRQRLKIPLKLSGSWTVGVGYFKSIRLIWKLAAVITGFELDQQTSIQQQQQQYYCLDICSFYTAPPILPLQCNFIWFSSDAKAQIQLTTVDPNAYFTLPHNQVIILLLPIRTTYGFIFGSTQATQVQVLLPSVEQTTGNLKFYGDDYATLNPVIIEQCSNADSLQLASQALGRSFDLSSIKFSVPNMLAASTISWEFGVGSDREYVPSDSSTFRFDIGFLVFQNEAANKLECEIRNTNDTISYIWKSVDVSVAGEISLKLKYDLLDPADHTFRIVCNNGQNPGVLSRDQAQQGIQALWVEQAGGATIQKAEALMQQMGLADNQALPYISKKMLNNPGYNAMYVFSITNGAQKLIQSSRLYVRFHKGISSNLNRLGVVSCFIDGVSSICQVTDDRLVKVWPGLVIDAHTVFNLTVSPVTQPSFANFPPQAPIWIAMDSDDDLSNGILFQSYTQYPDPQPCTTTVSPLVVTLTAISGLYIRTEQTHIFNVYLPAGTVYEGNILLVEFPVYYMESLELKSDNSLYSNTPITALVSRYDDKMKINFAKRVEVIAGNLVQITLSQDNMNNFQMLYIVKLRSVPMPKLQVPKDPLNEFQILIHSTTRQTIDNTSIDCVRSTSTIYYNNPISLLRENKLRLFWNGSLFNYQRNENLERPHIQMGESGITVYQGVFRTLVSISPSTILDTDIIQSTFQFQLEGDTGLQTYPTQLLAKVGTKNSKFLLAASSNLLPGYYVFKINKLAGGENYVNSFPFLNLFVIKEQCQLTTDRLTYALPIGGTSPPIIIDLQACFPASDLRIQLILTPDLVVLTPNPQSILYESWSTTYSEGSLHFPIHQALFILLNVPTPDQGSLATVSFTLDGGSKDYYLPPPPITINFFEASQLDNNLTAIFVATPKSNSIEFHLSCSDIAIVHWVIGVGGEIQYIPQIQIRNNTLNQNRVRTLRDPFDTEWKIYGVGWVGLDSELIEQFDNLKANDLYTLKQYCVNQIGLVSNPLVYEWKTPQNKGKLIKLIIETDREFNYLQKLKLVCAMNKIFPINLNRIFDAQSVECDIDTIIRIGQLTTQQRILAANNDNQTFVLDGTIHLQDIALINFIYFYPDQTLENDNIVDIITQRLLNSTQFIYDLSLTMNLDPLSDPFISKVSYIFPDQVTQPKFKYTQPLIKPTQIQINFTMRDCDGFVGVGIDQTDSAKNPSVLQMRRSLNYLNRTFQTSHLIFFNQTQQDRSNGQTQVVVFDKLTSNLQYKIFWFSSNDDCGYWQKFTEVESIVVVTTQQYEVIFAMIAMVPLLLNIINI